MRTPQPPYLEFGFYFHASRGNQALSRLYNYLVQNGSEPSGSVRVHLGRNISEYGFASAEDHKISEVIVADHTDILNLLNNRNVRVISMGLQHATQIAPGVGELIAQIDIDPRSTARDSHPVAVLVDGARVSPFES